MKKPSNRPVWLGVKTNHPHALGIALRRLADLEDAIFRLQLDRNRLLATIDLAREHERKRR